MKNPKLWAVYTNWRDQILRLIDLRYYIYDITNSYKYMNWLCKEPKKLELASKLLFQYHKLEKGLVMPGEKRVFGTLPAKEVINLIEHWSKNGFELNDTIYQGALSTLQSYRNRIYDLDKNHPIVTEIDEILSDRVIVKSKDELSTPIIKKTLEINNGKLAKDFDSLMLSRTSVRNYLEKKVSENTIRKILITAQQSPSACNRQPWTVDVVSDDKIRSELLSLQNGNLGFGHLAPHIAVISCDESSFFGISERHEPYIDGGLFSMGLILTMESHGISSCCLNWCVNPKKDKAIHRLLNLELSKRVIMLVAFGYAPEDTVVPRSPRKDLDEVLRIH